MVDEKELDGKLTIDTRELDNKSRQGEYLYLRFTGNRSAYYKKDDSVPREAYISHYIDQYIEGTDSDLREKKRRWKRLMEDDIDTSTVLEKSKGINTNKIVGNFSRGKTSREIPLNQASDTQIRQMYKDILEEHVDDNGLVKFLVQNINNSQIRNRFEMSIDYYNKEGEYISSASNVGANAWKAKSDAKKSIQGMKNNDYTTVNNMKNRGYTFDIKKKDIPSSAVLRITFRKG